MAIRFLVGTTSKVDHGSLGSFDPAALTICAWVYFDNVANAFAAIATKWTVTQTGIQFNRKGTAGTVLIAKRTYATSENSVESPAGTLTVGWNFCAFTNIDATPTLSVYRGTLSSLARDVSATRTLGGSGGPVSVATQVLNVGATNVGLDGPAARIANIGVFNRVLSLQEIQAWQLQPQVMAGCLLFCRYGHTKAVRQIDWSGNNNHGTVTGALVGTDPPFYVNHAVKLQKRLGALAPPPLQPWQLQAQMGGLLAQ